MKADPNDSLARSSMISSRITDGPALDWAALVPLTLHPVKVSIVEAMEWIGEPVSATELTEMFEEPEGNYLSLVSYHMGKLVDLGAVEKISHRAVRGARETFYFLDPAMTVALSR
jgi:DNA-binding transcriptional ArsR family regulator